MVVVVAGRGDHGGHLDAHTLLKEAILSYSLLCPLFSDLSLDASADGNRAVCLVTILGVRIAQEKELLADGTIACHT